MSTASAGSDSGPDRDKAVQALRGLGLTRTEADVYFTALQTCSAEPVSSYKLAQVMGRDPANVAKTLTALVRLQAMTVVQDKPRLFLPTDPAVFTDQVMTRVQQQGDEAVELLRHFQAPQPDGITLGLSGAGQVFDKARELLSGCQAQAQVFGSKESLRELGSELEELGENPDCTVRVLSPLDMVSESVDIAVFSPLTDLSELLTTEFLLMAVDNRAWLSAMIEKEASTTPGGWWGDHSPIAGVIGGALALAWQAGRPPQAAIVDSTRVTVETPEPDVAPPPAPVAEPVIAVEKSKTTEEEPAAEDTADFEEGITFLMRHEDEEKK